MSYITIEYIIDNCDKRDLILMLNNEKRPEIEIDFDNAKDPVTIRLNNIIKRVVGKIDGYLAAKFTLPLSTVPEEIEGIAFDLVIYYCYKRRHANDMSEDMKKMYSGCMSTLKDIQNGTFSLNLPATESSESAGGIVVNKTESDQYFNKDLMGRF